MVVLGMVLATVTGATLGAQRVFVQNQIATEMTLRAEHALDRIVSLTSQALTVDAQFSTLKPTTGVDGHCLRFRLVSSIDATTGEPVYDDAARVFIYGPDTGTNPCDGVLVGRGADLDAIYATARGADNRLGTADDNTSVVLASGVPAVELLLPSNYAPQTGAMLTINLSPAPIGRLVTFTLRVNAVGMDGSFIYPNDLVFVERVALRQ